MTEQQTVTRPPVRRAAPSDYPIAEALAQRWSPRALDPDRAPTREQVLTVLEAARWAPSSRNEQPWRFLVFDGETPEARDRARACLNDGNKLWALKAPVLVMTIVKTTWLNREGEVATNRVALHDVGAAAMSMAVQATHEGLILHQMGGFNVAKAKEDFGLPEEYQPVAMIAIGYPGQIDQLDERNAGREMNPRKRKPLGEIAFHGEWEQPIVPVDD